jgi:hypothetical protein
MDDYGIGKGDFIAWIQHFLLWQWPNYDHRKRKRDRQRSEYGSSGVADDETDVYTLNSSGSWAQSSGSANDTKAGAQGVTVSGSASYAHPVASGTIDGTVYVSDGWGQTDTFTIHASYSGGAWHKSGNGTIINSSFNNASYSGSGAFTGAGNGFSGAVETISGTLTEDGHSDRGVQERDYFNLVLQSDTSSGSGSASSGEWLQSSGLRTYTNSKENYAGFSGSGDYSHTVPGGSVSGTANEGGDKDRTSDFTKYVKYASGVWATSSGSGSHTKSSGTHWSFQGTGAYAAAVSIPGGLQETVTGVVTESAGSAYSISQSDDYELDIAQNAWDKTGATGKTTNSSRPLNFSRFQR